MATNLRSAVLSCVRDRRGNFSGSGRIRALDLSLMTSGEPAVFRDDNDDSVSRVCDGWFA